MSRTKVLAQGHNAGQEPGGGRHLQENTASRIWANYMLGLPTEAKEEVMDTISMLTRDRPRLVQPGILHTPPRQ